MENGSNYNVSNSECNRIFLYGTIEKPFTFDHNSHYRNFYKAILKVKRLSGIDDYLKIIVSESLIPNVDEYVKGTAVEIRGNIRSYTNKKIETKPKLLIYVYPYYINIIKDSSELQIEDYINYTHLKGYIFKIPSVRTTSKGKKVVQVFLRVNNKKGVDEFSTIPCVAWYKEADYLSKCSIGDMIDLDGRFQSRIFNKYNEETGEIVDIMVHEVAISSLFGI